MCFLSESEAQASQRVAILWRRGIPGGNVAGSSAGVRPVEEGGSSCSSGPAVPEDVEESAPLKKLVAPSAPTTADPEEHTASGHAVSGLGVASVASDVAECISIVQEEEKPQFRRLPLTTVS